MIYEEFITINAHSSNYKYYTNLGYVIQVRKPFIVKVKDLMRGSNVIITSICCNCNGHSKNPYKDYFISTNGLTEEFYCKHCNYIKSEKTCLTKYNVKNPMQDECIRLNYNKSIKEKYGVEHYSQTDEYKEKFKKTCIIRYNVDNPFKSEEIKQNIRNKNIDNLDVEYPMQSPEIQQKSKDTCKLKYGVEHYSQTDECKKQVLITTNLNYGVNNISQSLVIREAVFLILSHKVNTNLTYQIILFQFINIIIIALGYLIHTQLSSNPSSALDFIMDGVISTGSSPSVFGTSSSYFTNLYPGLFVLVADDIELSSFSIIGNLGADGSGTMDSYDYILDSFSIDYAVYVKRVWDTSDPSVNHIIIVDGDGTGITHSFSTDTDNDSDSLIGINSVSKIHYLLTSKSNGMYITNQEIESIVNAYLSIVDNKDLTTALSDLNSNYSNITDILGGDLFYFSDQGNNNINDGGDDMYDNGNIISPILISQGEYNISKLAYFGLDGVLIDSISSSSDIIDQEDLIGIRAMGRLSDGFYIFNGSTIDTLEISYNAL